MSLSLHELNPILGGGHLARFSTLPGRHTFTWILLSWAKAIFCPVGQKSQNYSPHLLSWTPLIWALLCQKQHSQKCNQVGFLFKNMKKIVVVTSRHEDSCTHTQTQKWKWSLLFWQINPPAPLCSYQFPFSVTLVWRCKQFWLKCQKSAAFAGWKLKSESEGAGEVELRASAKVAHQLN